MIDFPIVTNKLPASYAELEQMIKLYDEAVAKGQEAPNSVVNASIMTANAVILTQGCLLSGPSGPKVD